MGGTVTPVPPTLVSDTALPPLVLLAGLARQQGGVFTREQARASGFTRDAIAHRVRTGRWLRLHGSVLAAATSDVGLRGRRWGALLHAGRAAVLSHRSAADLWGLGVVDRGPVHLTTTAGRTPHVPGAQVVRTALAPDELQVREGMPVTSRDRTLLDCLATVSPSEARDLLERCDRHRWLTPRQLDALIASRARAPGVAQLRRLQTSHHLRTGSHAARLLGRLLTDSDVLGWVAEHPVLTADGVQTVPVAFPELRLALAVDDRRPGPVSRPATEDRELVLAGWMVLHLDWDEVHGPPRVLREVLVRALTAAARSPAVGAP